MAFGSTPISTTTLGTNQYPVSAVAVPGHSGGNLTAVEGGPASTDGNGNETAPVSSYIKDGGDAAQGTTTDAANANTVVGQLKQIKTNTASVVVASLPALPAGTNVIGHVIVDSAGAVSVTSLPSIPAGTNVIGHVIVDSASSVAVTALPTLPSGTNVIGHIIADSGSTTAVTSLPALPTGGNTIGAVTQAGTWTVQPGNTPNTTAWKVDGSAVTQPISGAVTQGAGAAAGTNWRISGDFTEQASLSAASLNADLVPSTDVSAYKSFSLQILTVASGGVMTFQGCNDNASWQPVNYYFASTQASPGNVQGSAGIYYGPCVFRYLRVRQTSWTSGSSTGVLELYTHAAGIPPTNITVQNNSQATGSGIGTTGFHLISAASTNATNFKGFNGQVYGYEIGNSNAANRYVKLYNKSSTPTVGTDTPFRTILVPPNGRAFFHSSTGLKMPNGIGIATTTGIADTDSTAVGLNDLSIDIDYV